MTVYRCLRKTWASAFSTTGLLCWSGPCTINIPLSWPGAAGLCPAACAPNAKAATAAQQNSARKRCSHLPTMTTPPLLLPVRGTLDLPAPSTANLNGLHYRRFPQSFTAGQCSTSQGLRVVLYGEEAIDFV